MIVLKFGGTSVGDAEAIKRTAAIVKTRLDRKPIVVVSALAGVTNALLAIGEQSAKGHLIGAVRSVEAIRARHIEQAEKMLGSTDECADVCAEMSALCDELAHLAEALATLGDATPRSFDLIAAFGEQLSSMLVATVLKHEGLDAVHVDGRQVMITDEQYMKAEPQPEAIAEASRAHILPHVTAGRIPVMGGFIGSAKGKGTTTTLGRGGGDYSASLVGAAIRAEAIEIWTDVDGMLTADPRVVPEAKSIERIGFDEASELASFGAKVLHPSTIAPAVRLGIPVYILNSKRPEGSGTVITFEAPRRGVSAIAGKNDVTLIRVGSPRMLLTDGFMRALFEVFARHRTSIDVVATSEVSVSVTVDDATRLPALLPDLRDLGDVALERNRGIVAVVGAALREGGSHMSRAMSALGDVSVHMLSLSATGINLTIVVDDDQVKPAMKRLHAEFFGDAEMTTRLAIVGMGKMGHAIEQLAAERGCEIVARLDVAETSKGITAAMLNGADVAVEFTTPASAAANVSGLVAAGVPTVVGTTGWYDALPGIAADVKKRNGALLTATNFSLGVNAFEAILSQAAAILAAAGGFDAHMIEMHHSAKKDAPSGTAHTLEKSASAAWGREIPITSVRTGSIPGTHEVIFDAPFETIRIAHVARDRKVFAEGAIVAAKWLAGKKGVFTMKDVISTGRT